MFEKAGWREVDPLLGPVPVAPCPGWSVDELLRWSPRAPFDAQWLGALQRVDASSLDDLQRLRLVQSWDRLRKGVEAGFIAAVGSVEVQSCSVDGPRAACPGGSRCTHDWSVEEVAAALHLAPVTASSLLRDARELAGQCLVLREAVADGRLPAYAARAIAMRLSSASDPEEVEAVLARVVSRLGLVTPSQLIRLADVTLEALRDPAEALAAHRRARRAGTGITHGMPLEDGMASAVVTASVAEIAELLAWAREFTVRNRDADDTRTVGERRVHALLDCLQQTASSGVSADVPSESFGTSAAASGSANACKDDAGESGGERSTGSTESGARGATGSGAGGATGSGAGGATESGGGGATESGAGSTESGAGGATESGAGGATESGAGGATESGAGEAIRDRRPAQRAAISLRLIMSADTLLGRDNDPAWLTGVGVIPAYLARTLAVAPASLQRALQDRNGVLLNLGRAYRLPTTALAEHIRARDHFCTGLGCTRSSDKSELDHIIAWADGGQTNVDDLHPNCPRHHRSQDAGWSVSRTSECTSWTSPTGITYESVRPPPEQPGTAPHESPPPERERDPLESPPPPGKPPLPPPEDPPF